jgi:hypothetical protein
MGNTHKGPGHLAAIAVLTVIILVALCIPIVIGTAFWAGTCYAEHKNEQVRWTFPDGCQVSSGGTWVTVGI